VHDIPPTDIIQSYKQQMHILKRSLWKVSYCYMFRHRRALLRDSHKRSI